MDLKKECMFRIENKTLNVRCFGVSHVCLNLKYCLFVCLCITCVRIWLFVQDFASRPSSQMSHTPSSGYGSARSTNRTTISEMVSANDRQTTTSYGQQGRSRNSLLNSLHKPKAADAGLRFRSLRVPRAVPSSVSGGNDSAEFACQPSENKEIITLPLHTVATHEGNLQLQHEQQLSIPVPAPRFHTLKRHAYQNIPAPLKNTQMKNQEHQDNQNQFMQVTLASIHVPFCGA